MNTMSMPEIGNNAEVKSKYEEFLTHQGKCKWPKVLKPFIDEYNPEGAFSIELELEANDGAPIKSEIRNRMLRKADQEEEAGRNVKGWSDSRGFVENEVTGLYIFEFSQKAVVHPKDTSKGPLHFKVDVFDSQLTPWPKDILIGNGSIVKVAYQYYPWNVPNQGGIGMTLKLRGVQVINLVPYEAPQRTYGFTKEEGTVVDNPITRGQENSQSLSDTDQEESTKPATNDDIPF